MLTVHLCMLCVCKNTIKLLSSRTKNMKYIIVCDRRSAACMKPLLHIIIQYLNLNIHRFTWVVKKHQNLFDVLSMGLVEILPGRHGD